MIRAHSGTQSVASDAKVIEESWLDPECFAVVFDRHAPYIHRYLARRVGGQAADDLVAETFLAAFGKRRGYDLAFRDARPWLYGIATNLIGQHRREEARRYQIRLAARPEPDLPGHAERVAADVTAQSARALLATALTRLAAGDRDVLLLVAWEQLTYHEVARALGVPVGTVRSRLNRARTQIRDSLTSTGQAGIVKEILNND
jgi:RNA polymerase sigma factor (sigma-70 family)